MRRVLNLGELPTQLVAVINQARFVEAFYMPDRGRFVARHILPNGRREELEYDEVLRRTLTTDERIAEIPASKTVRMADENITVSTTYFIDPATSQLRATLDVVDDSGEKLASSVRLVHVDGPADDESVIQDALQRRRFHLEYATWSRDRRIAHWAYVIHRFRRVHGESGRNEDEIYTPNLVKDLERTEPNLRGMLAEILRQVGFLEQTPAAEAIAAFTSRTGIAVEP